MNNSSSVWYNESNKYDPTMGAALASISRSERKMIRTPETKPIMKKEHKPEPSGMIFRLAYKAKD